ncbi:MAG TPA: glycosyltransferase family 2 protein [Caulobacteraceae bacterium]|jgi:tetratricopeptide (TPR) repeat protein|nr:glycosyltransferase family 2 protein [Caulobacteraceae bacterium]
MQLAVVMIVRDEARCLARCLASIRPFVDEMVVLDTGSTDATVEIAAAAGARIGHFGWIDDFAAARNAALDLSDADWNLVLDADNWLIRAPGLRAALGAPAFIGEVTIENHIEVGGRPELAVASEARLLPRGVRYTGRIHEQPQSVLPHRPLDVVLGHDGYLGGQLARKGERNETLLLRSIEATPNDGYLWYQLGREYDVAARYDAARIAFAEALRLTDASAPWRLNLLVRGLHVLTQAGALDEALGLAQGEDAHWPASPDWHFTLGVLFMTCAGRDEANALRQWLPWAEARWRRCLEIGETPGTAGAVRGRGGHMAAHNLAALYGTFGPPAEAAKYEALALTLRNAA